MIVCRNCLEAIESHEGNQWQKKIEFDDERINDYGECFCEWCEDYHSSSECVEI